MWLVVYGNAFNHISPSSKLQWGGEQRKQRPVKWRAVRRVQKGANLVGSERVPFLPAILMVLLETWWDVNTKAVVKVITAWHHRTAAVLDPKGHYFTVTCDENREMG